MTNLATGTKFQGIDNWGGRARLKFAPTETLTIDLTAELSRDGDKAAFSGFHRGSGPASSLAGVDTPANPNSDRTSVVQGKSVSVRVHLGGRRVINKINRRITYTTHSTIPQTTGQSQEEQ